MGDDEGLSKRVSMPQGAPDTALRLRSTYPRDASGEQIPLLIAGLKLLIGHGARTWLKFIREQFLA